MLPYISEPQKKQMTKMYLLDSPLTEIFTVVASWRSIFS